MKSLRTLHLYLGCVFAPMLVFFSLSGLWQLFVPLESQPTWLRLLSTIHTSRGLKAAGNITNLSSIALSWVAGAMAIGLIVTIVLGVIMAFRTGRTRPALVALAAGIVVPVSLILIAVTH